MGTLRKSGKRKAASGQHECDDSLVAAKRLHARGCRGITNAAAAWHDLAFQEKMIWLNLAGQLAQGGAR